MRPLKLILEGVYSYRNKTEIDFETLCGADLFGIFGNVGSGKSAILEAITYALYGRIERLPVKKLNYNMMNLMSDRMYIDFTFIHTGGRYRFSFEAKRNKKNFEKIETPERGGYIERDGEWVPLFDKDSDVTADEIIGLNYDNFRRTIIVPQGRFQEFLHLEKSKRTEMLMELFQLDRFDLFDGASALAGRNARDSAVIEGELSGLSDVDAAKIEDARAELSEIDRRLLGLEADIKRSDRELSQWEEVRRLTASLEETKQRLELKLGQSGDIDNRKKTLLRFETCRELFRHDMGNIDAVKIEIEAAGRSAEDASELLEVDRSAFEASSGEFEAISREQQKLDELRNKTSWYQILIKLKAEEEAFSALQEALSAEQAELALLQERGSVCGSELEQLRSELSALDTGPLTPDLMRQYSSAFASVEEHNSTISFELENLKKAADEAEEIAGMISGLPGWAEIRSFSRAQRPPETLEEADEIARILEEGNDELEAELRGRILSASVSSEVRKMAQALEDGKACPVCGSLEHPFPATAARYSDSELRAEQDTLDKRRAVLAALRRNLADLRDKSSLIAGRTGSIKERLSVKRESLDKLLKEFPSGPFRPEDAAAFRAAWDEFVEIDEKKQHLQQMISALSLEAENCEKNLRAKEAHIHQLKINSAAQEAGISGRREGVDGAFYDSCRGLDASHLAGELRKTESEISRISLEYQRLENLNAENGLKYEKRITEHSLKQARLNELTDRIIKMEKMLENKIADSGYSGIDEIAGVLDLDLDPEREREEIALFLREQDRLQAELSRLEAELDGRDYDDEKHHLAAAENLKLKQYQTQTAAASGKFHSLIADLTRRLGRKLELQNKLDRLKIRGENINTLRNLFKGKKFIDYAATVYLRELCEAANIRFRKLTRESLRLELDESNNFIVRDYLNEGKIRSVKTLSGGQTFQAAFSLSLALADSIGKERSGFFFLDEGFGSLDRESLALVFESLKSLKHEERTVGIISHVEELKQEIDTYITVKKETEDGSLIISSWNS